MKRSVVSCQKPELYDFGQVKLVDLYGSWEDMGRQYGALAAPMLLHVKSYLDGYRAQSTQKDSLIRDMGMKLYRSCPSQYRSFMYGISQTSGLSIEEVVTLNGIEYSEGFFCSCLALWGDYAKGNLVVGRNYDAAHYKELEQDLLITVFHPSDGSLATATIGWAGEIYAVNGINEKGLFVELNNGMPSAGFDVDFDLIPSTTHLLDLMFRASDMEYVDRFFKSTISFSSFIICVADSHAARAYEWCRQGVKRADIVHPDGMLAATNHYVNPEWPFPVPTNAQSWNSHIRFDNLKAQAQEFKGKADAAAVGKIMDTDLAGGGPKHDFTRYQFVFEPATMTLHFKLPDSPEYDVIDLSSFLLPSSR